VFLNLTAYFIAPFAPSCCSTTTWAGGTTGPGSTSSTTSGRVIGWGFRGVGRRCRRIRAVLVSEAYTGALARHTRLGRPQHVSWAPSGTVLAYLATYRLRHLDEAGEGRIATTGQPA